MIVEPEAFRGSRTDSLTAAPPAGADLRDLIGVLYAARRFIGICVLAALALAGAYLAVSKKAYTSTVSILVDARGRGPVGSDQTNQLNISPDATLVESQVKLLSSDTVLRRVVIRENLGADQEFVPTQPGLRATIFAAIGLGSPAPVGEDRTARALAAFSRNVSVKRSERTYVIDVDVSTSDPQKSARLANDIADAYIADQQDAKSDLVRRDTVWLKERVADLQERVRQADNKVQQYKQEHRITDASGKLVNEQELSELTTELAKARTRTTEAKSKYDQAQRIIASGKIPDSTSDALKSAMLDKLRGQFAEIVRQDANYRTTLGERHPALKEVQTQLRDTRQLIIEEVRRISDGASNEYQVARANETEIHRRIDQARGVTNTTNQSIVQLKELERDADATRTVFERFLRARESIAADLTEGPVARVIAPASPPQAPSSPKTFAILAIALAAGLFLGSGSALVREYMAVSATQPTPGLRTAATIVAPSNGGVRVIGSVPLVSQPASAASAIQRIRDLVNRRKPAPPVALSLLDMLARDPQSPYSKAVSAAAKSLGLQGDRKGRGPQARTILVTSPSHGVGKTSIAVNLARAACAAGASVLLIDANRARPSLKELVAPNARPSLIDLPGETRVVYRLDADDNGELYVVPILEAEEAIVRRLTHRSTTQRFEGFSGVFDLVLIDGPSIDDEETRQIAQAVDRVVVVADAAQADAIDAETLMQDLDIPRRKLAGAILSKARAARAA